MTVRLNAATTAAFAPASRNKPTDKVDPAGVAV